jgi:hypothetical protein
MSKSEIAAQTVCPLCPTPALLVRSHIVPDSFTKHLSRSGAPFLLDGERRNRKRRPGGFYQDEFLCSNCEQRIGKWDAAAADVFFRDIAAWEPVTNAVWTPQSVPGAIQGWNLTNGAEEILLFFASLLWRAHASNRPEFEKVDLGEQADHFRAIADTGKIPPETPMRVLLCRFLPSTRAPGFERNLWILPYPTTLLNLACYSFQFGGWLAQIKVDSRPLSPEIEIGTVQPGTPMLAAAMAFDGSRFETSARSLAYDIMRSERKRSVVSATKRLERAIGRTVSESK